MRSGFLTLSPEAIGLPAAYHRGVFEAGLAFHRRVGSKGDGLGVAENIHSAIPQVRHARPTRSATLVHRRPSVMFPLRFAVENPQGSVHK